MIVPEAGRRIVLQELHNGHWGMTRMKSLARMYVWWLGIDLDIEQLVHKFNECQSMQSTPMVAPLHPWKWPTRPWSRLHLDFAGPFLGKMFLILINSHSKWIEAFCTPNATTTTVIEVTFARFGLPDTIVSDNGPCFVSEEFKQYLQQNGIKQITSAPYHPATNGLAERAIQVVKRGLKKVMDGTIQARIARVLFTYRITPQSTTGISPAELLMGRRPKSRLDLLKPSVSLHVENKQYQHKKDHDKVAKSRSFQAEQPVYVKNNGAGDTWLKGKIIKSTGAVSYRVKLEDGREWCCHQDHLHRAELVNQPSITVSMGSIATSDFTTESAETQDDNTTATENSTAAASSESPTA